MTVSPLLIYGINICDNIIGLSLAAICVSIIVIIFSLICQSDLRPYWEEDRGKIKACKTWRRVASIALSISILFVVMLPSSETLTMMYIFPNLSNSQVLQKLPDELQQYINQVLEKPNDTH